MLTYSKKLVLLGYHTWLLNHNKNHMKVLLGNDLNPLSSNKQSLNGLLIDSEKRLRDCRLICNLDYSITKIDTKNIKTMNNSNHFGRLTNQIPYSFVRFPQYSNHLMYHYKLDLQ